MSVSATRTTIAGRISRNMSVYSSGQMQGGDHEVDGLDADERNDHAADAVNPKITPKQLSGADRTIADAFERQRNQGDNDQRVEDDRRQDGALRGRQVHDVERLQLRVEGDEHRRDNGEIL